MKLQLNKKNLKNLSKDAQILPSDMTPNVGGGTLTTDPWIPTGTSGTVVGCGPDPATNTCGTGSCGCDTSMEECGPGRGDTNQCA